MKKLYVFNFLVTNFATKKTERISIKAPTFDQTKNALFEKYGSNYASRCKLTSFYPCKEGEVK